MSGAGASDVEEAVRLSRAPGLPAPAAWGFRLMGGRDYSHPLTVTRVVGLSLAERAGLRVGDVVMTVNGRRVAGCTHLEAQDAVREAGDVVTLGVVRSPFEMPPPLEVDVPILQPLLAQEPPPSFENSTAEEETTGTAASTQMESQLDPPFEPVEPGIQEDPICEEEDMPVAVEVDFENNEDSDGECGDSENEEEEEELDEGEENEEARKDRLDKLDGLRRRMSRSPGPRDILLMQEKALARMEEARARPDRPPTVFMLPPDRPPIRLPKKPRPRPPDPPFKKLVLERIRRRKWEEEHPGEEYPFADESVRTPTPELDSENTRATMTPTPTLSDGAELETADADELTQDGLDIGEDDLGIGEAEVDDLEVEEPRIAAEPEIQPVEEPVVEPLSVEIIESTQRQLEQVTDQLEALLNLPNNLRPGVERAREELQGLRCELQSQIQELHRREQERIAAEEEAARLAFEKEAAKRKEELEIAIKAEQAAIEAERLENEANKKPVLKTNVPDFIHEMTEKLSLERPSFPLTPLPRPIVLPGGRKWRTVQDAFNEDFIAEILTSQAEVLLGQTLGNRRKSKTFPALIHERAELNESCYGCGRVNFHKYSHKYDHLKNSAVYRMVHGLDDHDPSPIEHREGCAQSIQDYYDAAARSAASSPMPHLEKTNC